MAQQKVNLRFFRNYNNYFNRIVKHESSVSSITATHVDLLSTNFVPQDVITEHVVNWTDSWAPDYMIEYDGDTILSRWFVMEFERLRGNQSRATLKRDTVAEHYSSIINKPAYIEKATLKDIYDPAIFNKEELEVNQIKKSETSLQDDSHMGWLVAWISSKENNTDFKAHFMDGQRPLTVPYSREVSTNIDYTTSNITSWVNDHGLNSTYKVLKDPEDYVALKVSSLANRDNPPDYNKVNYKFYRDGSVATSSATEPWDVDDQYKVKFTYGTPSAAIISRLDSMRSTLFSHLNSTLGITAYTDPVFSYEDAIVKDTSDNKLYRVIPHYGSWSVTSPTAFDTNNIISIDIASLTDGLSGETSYEASGDIVFFEIKDVTNDLVVTSSLYADIGSLNPSTSNLIDAPYMAICIPYTTNISKDTSVRQDTVTDHKQNDPSQDITFNINDGQAFSAATLLSYALQDNAGLLDVQLLPYCPILNEITMTGTNSMNLDSRTINETRKIYFYKTDGINFNKNTPLAIGYVFYRSTFTFNITHSIPDRPNAVSKKLFSETTKYRLCSPNYSSYFDFNPYMNHGVDYFNVDCTYKPYKSYIHMNPNFKGYYGADYNDQRGLIIISDFSIPQVTDAWREYQINNKNYSNIFDRQMQNLDVTQKWERREALVNAITAPISGGTSGALAGGMAGGVWGAVAGGVVGTGAGTAGGVMDYLRTKELQQEQKNYLTDMYNYNLQNVQALPQTISSVSSYDANNKLWPFLEFYSCSSWEFVAMSDKIKYNGMKVGRIGNMSDFIDPNERTYIKCQLIRSESEGEDYSVLDDIAQELNKGVFI